MKKGYALDEEEYEEGVKCVAAPIFDYMRSVIGALSISGPSNRLGNERLENELAPLVADAAYEISRRLGYRLQRDSSE